MNDQEKIALLMERFEQMACAQSGLVMIVSLLIQRSPDAQALKAELPQILEKLDGSALFHPISDDHVEFARTMVRSLLQ